MTTGRINQVTIVRRGWPTSAARALERCSKLLVGARGRAARAPGGGQERCAAVRFPPLRSPGHCPPHVPCPGAVGCDVGAQVGGSTSRRPPLRRRPASDYPPLLCGASRHRPVAHRTHTAPRREQDSPENRASPGTPCRRSDRFRRRGGRRWLGVGEEDCHPSRKVNSAKAA
jgi:hypothetical protein